MADTPPKAEMGWEPLRGPTGLPVAVSEDSIPSTASPHTGALKWPAEDGHDWRVLLPDQLTDANGREFSLHYFAQDQMDFLKIPEWRRYDAIAYSYSAAKAFYGDKMTFGIFMERLRDCKMPNPTKQVNIDYLAEINDMIEGGQ